MIRCVSKLVSVSFGIVICLFWAILHPEALSFQEQNQLFLWDGEYFIERISVAGGLADYISEFLVQFYYFPWLGSVVIALLLLGIQLIQYKLQGGRLFMLSFMPSVMLLWAMGDENLLLSYVVALLMVLLAVLLLRNTKLLIDVGVIPVMYWLSGPMTLVYVLLRIAGFNKEGVFKVSSLLELPLLFGLQVVAYSLFLTQWPFVSVMCGINYYRIPMHFVPIMFVIPAVAVMAILAGRYLKVQMESKLLVIFQCILLTALSWCAVVMGYDGDKYELLKQDYLIRGEKWNEIISRAEEYQVKCNFSSQSVNLALAMTRQLADRQFEFYQSGEDALFMPMVRDNVSDMPTMEAFYRLGFINSSLRYAHDIQESILNARKSGRLTKRIVECYLVNGNYRIAQKHIDLLKKSLFYRKWATNVESIMAKEELISNNHEFGRQRKIRFKKDFLYSYPEMDKMLAILFVDNPDNKMALDYFMGQMLLNGNIQGFMQYMSWVQRYGGYQMMPLGYQDAAKAIQAQGNAPGSRYAEYVKQMTMKSQNRKEGK